MWFADISWRQFRRSLGGFSAIVCKQEDDVWAEDQYGKTIAQGEAGVDDAQVIQSAIDAVEKGIVFLARGTYQCVRDSPAQIYLKSYVSLVGEGKDATRLIINRANGVSKGDGISISNTVGARLISIRVDAKTHDQQAAVVGSNVSDFVACDCRFENLDNVFAVYFAGSSSPDVDNEVLDKNNKLINCEIYGEYTGDVLSWSFQMDSEIAGCKIYGRVALYKGKNVNFHHNFIYDSPNEGIWITGKYYNAHINNNIIRGTPSYAIRNSGEVYGLVISDNLIYRTGPSGAATIGLFDYIEGVVANNYITYTKAAAIGIACNGILKVVNNIAKNCNRDNKYWYNGGSIFGISGYKDLFLEFRNNIAYDLNTNGAPMTISLGGNEPKAEAIFEGNIFNRSNSFHGADHPTLGNTANSELYMIAKNYLAKFKMERNYAFTDSAPEKVLLKTGNENSGSKTISGDGVTTDFEIGAHGLVTTDPSKIVVKVSPISSDAIDASPCIGYVDPSDNTKIRVKFGSPPASGSDNVKITWEAIVIG